jgi:hypothetical protein
MLKVVDPGGYTWWYQQIPYVEVTLIPVREPFMNALISLDQAFIGRSISSFGTF